MAGNQAEKEAAKVPGTKPKVKVVQVKSGVGRLRKHQACLVGLGLRRIGHQVEVEDTPAVRGMIDRVRHLVSVVED